MRKQGKKSSNSEFITADLENFQPPLHHDALSEWEGTLLLKAIQSNSTTENGIDACSSPREARNQPLTKHYREVNKGLYVVV